MKFPIGVQLFSVRDNCAADLPGTLKKIKEMGYEGVEPYTLYDYTPEEFRKLLDDNGLKAFSSHVSVQEYENNGFEKVVQMYKTVGVDYLTIPYLIGDHYPGESKFYETVASAQKIAEECEKAGIGFAYHNHEHELGVLPTGVTRLDALYSVIPQIQAEFDLGWLTKAGANPLEYIAKYTGRLPLVHVKELAWTGAGPKSVRAAAGIECDCPEDPASEFVFKPLGQGIMPFEKIFEALEKAGTRYLIVEQDNPTPGMDIMDCIAESARYLKAHLD